MEYNAPEIRIYDVDKCMMSYYETLEYLENTFDDVDEYMKIFWDNWEKAGKFADAYLKIGEILRDTFAEAFKKKRDKELEKESGNYSFNIESILYTQLNAKQRKIWVKELERAFIAGADWQLKQNNKDNKFNFVFNKNTENNENKTIEKIKEES